MRGITFLLLVAASLWISPAYANGEHESEHVSSELKCNLADGGGGGSGGGKTDPGNDATKNHKVYGPCPAKAMSHMTTEAVPLAGESSPFSPALWAPLLMEEEGSGGKKKKVLWESVYARGTKGNYADISAFIGEDEPCNAEEAQHEPQSGGRKRNCHRMNAAYNQVEPKKEPKDRAERACVNRVKMAQAASQTIMSAALKPQNGPEGRHIAWEEGIDQPGKFMSPENHCQTYTKVYDAENEYAPSEYIKTAYKKTMEDHSHRLRNSGNTHTSFLPVKTDNSLFALLFGSARAALGGGSPVDEPGYDIKRIKNAAPYQGKAESSQTENINTIIASTNGKKGQEAIFDTTHPFTPRWDFHDNERDWGSPKGAIYSKYEKDNVACADKPEPVDRACGMRDKGPTKVDMLQVRKKGTGKDDSRRGKFTKPMKKRIDLNVQCWLDTGLPAYPCCDPNDPSGKCKPLPCWKCFTDTQQKQDTKKIFPPCSTTWVQKKDLSILPKYIPIKGFRKLPCGESAPSLCAKLRRPYRPLNMLTMRRSQPGHKENRLDVKPDGSPDKRREGFTHLDYFHCHMPYPIQQDTGRHIADVKGPTQDAMDFAGQFTSIVGVGRPIKSTGGSSSGSASLRGPFAMLMTPEDESGQIYNRIIPSPRQGYAWAASSGGLNNEKSDQRCKYGGWGKETDCAGMKFAGPNSKSGKLADPSTAWTELLMYQAQGIRKYHINCLLQQHKAFSPLNGPSKALMASGGAFEREVCTKRNKDGTSTDCDAGGGGGSGGGSGGQEFMEFRDMSWPIAERGQNCTPAQRKEDHDRPKDKRICFPNFAAKEEDKGIVTGLDKAKPGCIMILPKGGVGKGSGDWDDKEKDTGDEKPLLPSVAYIKSVHNKENTKDYDSCEDKKNCHVIVESSDDGFYPDICGNTQYLGAAMSRTIYKPDMMPEDMKKELEKIRKDNGSKASNKCVEPQFGYCELESWDKVKIYCPQDDVRDGTEGT